MMAIHVSDRRPVHRNGDEGIPVRRRDRAWAMETGGHEQETNKQKNN
jgi:hypothetical protein